jgi:hypothetical protein
MTEKRTWVKVRGTKHNEGKQRCSYGYEGSQAVQARPCGKGRIKRNLRRSEVEKVEGW